MKAKTLIAAALLIFVITSVAVLSIKEFSSDAKVASGVEVSGTKVIAYYFHGTKRCPTCLKIEKYSHEAIDSFYADKISEGVLEFRSLNFDEPQYGHIYKDYKLASQSLVVVRYKEGVQQEWENLDRVWELEGDQPQFFAYVKAGVGRYLDKLE